VLRAAGEIETTQENIQDWLELGEGDPGFHLQQFLPLFLSALPISLNFQFICFLSFFFFWSFRSIFCFINLDDPPPTN
jgi:hypothetical protein